MKAFFEKIFSKFKKKDLTSQNVAVPSEQPPKEKASVVAKRILRTALNVEKLCFYFILTFVLLITVECFARRSLWEGLTFLFRAPIPFLANYAIILCTLLLTLLVKRRIALISLISAVWLALGVTQFVLLSFRVTPLTAVDFSILSNVFSIISIYLSPFQIVLISSLILLALAAIVMLFIKVPKVPRAIFKCGLSVTISVALGALVFLLGFRTEALSDRFPNLSNAYKDYGFAYCFSLSLVDKGIDHPDGYSEEAVNTIMDGIEAGNFEEENDKKPNVIFVQLESLFDVNRLEDIQFSENPLPNLTELKNKYTSGLLTVPVIGAGTVNTEFEILTGMDVQHFGPGEYPYKSILKDNTCETVAYTLSQSGYMTHALHNHQGTFYARNEVYKNLGFTSFTPLEYMLSPEYNETFWAKDFVLTSEILNVMDSTEERDFVFAVSVQGHGKYPTDYVYQEGDVHVTEGIEDEELLSRYNYYLKQIHEMDAFVGQLTEAIMAYDEPTVMVFYGDHLPALSIENEMLAEGDIYQTEYLILSNCDLSPKKEPGTLHSYDVYPTVMEMIGNSDGIINRVHQVYGDDEDFLSKLEIMEYDLLYGKQYAFGGESPYPHMQSMTLGTRAILLESYEVIDNTLYVYGQNFTPYSVVTLDERRKDTEFIDNNTLRVTLGTFDDDIRSITVQQRTEKGETLTETERLPWSLPKSHDENDIITD